jgi:hypothetical protein
MYTHIDPLFCEALATTADRGEADAAALERLLDGSPAAARWADCSTLLVVLLDALTHGGRDARVLAAMHAFRAAGAVREQTEAALRTTIDAVERAQKVNEHIVVHLWEVCRLDILLSRMLAAAERVEGGDPIRWCGISEPAAHWLRTDPRTQHAAVTQQ